MVGSASTRSRRPTSRATSGWPSRWDIVVLVAAGAAAVGHGAGRARRAPRRLQGHRARRHAGSRRLGARQPGSSATRSPSASVASPPADPRSRTVSSTPPVTARPALAAALPAVRRTYCDHVVLTNAAQNGVIGVVVIMPGADMPAMTANQIRMVLKIGAAYGEELGLDRAIEILSDRRRRLRLPHAGASGARLRAGIRLGRQGRHRVLGHDRAGPGGHRVFRGRSTAPCLADAKDQSSSQRVASRVPGPAPETGSRMR